MPTEPDVLHPAPAPGVRRWVRRTRHSGTAALAEAAPSGAAAARLAPAGTLTEASRRRRALIRRSQWLMGLVIATLSTLLAAMIFGVWQDCRAMQRQVDQSAAELAALQAQEQVGRQRFAVLSSPKGREELMLEHGYIRPGDRILLFPATPEERRAAAIPKNDLSPHLESDTADTAASSGWRRGLTTLQDWWRSARRH